MCFESGFFNVKHRNVKNNNRSFLSQKKSRKLRVCRSILVHKAFTTEKRERGQLEELSNKVKNVENDWNASVSEKTGK